MAIGSVSAAHAARGLACCIMAGGPIYLKWAMETAPTLDVVVFALAREACAAPLLLAATCAVSRRAQRPRQRPQPVTGGAAAAAARAEAGQTMRRCPQRGDATWLLGLGLALWGNQLFFALGLANCDAVVAASLQQLLPLCTTCLAVYLGLEHWSGRLVAGVLLAAGGGLLIVLGPATAGRGTNGAAAGSSSSLGGVGLILLNTACTALYYVGLKRPPLSPLSPLTVTAFAFVVAAGCMAATAAAREALLAPTDGVARWALPRVAYGPLAYWVVLSSCLAYTLISYSSTHLAASTVGVYGCIQTLMSVVLAIVLLGEEVRWTNLGGLPIVAGVCLASQAASTGSRQRSGGGADKTACLDSLSLDTCSSSGGGGGTARRQGYAALSMLIDEPSDDQEPEGHQPKESRRAGQ